MPPVLARRSTVMPRLRQRRPILPGHHSVGHREAQGPPGRPKAGRPGGTDRHDQDREEGRGPDQPGGAGRAGAQEHGEPLVLIDSQSVLLLSASKPSRRGRGFMFADRAVPRPRGKAGANQPGTSERRGSSRRRWYDLQTVSTVVAARSNSGLPLRPRPPSSGWVRRTPPGRMDLCSPPARRSGED
jgi:hypothetical protein